MDSSDLLGRNWAELQGQLERLSDDQVLLLVERDDFDAEKLATLIERFPTQRRILSVLLAHPLLSDATLESHLLRADAQHLEWVVPYLEALERPPALLLDLSPGPDPEPADPETLQLDEAELEAIGQALEPPETLEAPSLTPNEGESESAALVLYRRGGGAAAESASASEPGVVRSSKADPRAQRRFKASILARLAKMTVGQKIALALKGNGYERLLLVRDHNRLVATSVLKSPKVTEPDIKLYSQFNVSDQVLRIIGLHREWTRRYTICLNLVKNPRTPRATSMNLIHRLTNVDLRSLQFNRDVPEQVRRDARKVLTVRNQRDLGQKGSRSG